MIICQTRALLVLILVEISLPPTLGVMVNITYSFLLPSRLGVELPSTENCCPYVELHENLTHGMVLPSVIGLGTQKGGTTTLHVYFSKNPLFDQPSRKELQFLASSDPKLTLERYLNFWKSNQERDVRKNGTTSVGGTLRHQNLTNSSSKTLFEVTPNYLMLPFSACRAKHHLPGAKFIAILRDPVGRTYSSFVFTKWVYNRFVNESYPYWKVQGFLKVVMEGISLVQSDPKCDFTNGKNDKSLHDCIGCLLHSQDKMTKCGLRPMALIKNQEGDFECLSFGKELILRSMYAAQLARWFTFLHPNKFFIINSEQFFKNPDKEMRRMLDFLGISQKYTDEMISSEVKANRYTSKWRPDPEDVLVAKSLLLEFYKRPNLELYRLLAETGHDGFVPFEEALRAMKLLDCSKDRIKKLGICTSALDTRSVHLRRTVLQNFSIVDNVQIKFMSEGVAWHDNYTTIMLITVASLLAVIPLSFCRKGHWQRNGRRVN